LMSAEPRDVFRGRSGLDLVPICVDVVQSCEGRADLLLVGFRVKRRVVRLMGAKSLSYEPLDSSPKRTFWALLLAVGEIVSKPNDELYSSPSVSERVRETGWDISHCPTRCVPFVYRRGHV
jgi:hypothetical protein